MFDLVRSNITSYYYPTFCATNNYLIAKLGLSTSCLATSRISSNFTRFDQLLHSEQFLLLSSNSEISERLLVLKLAFLHISQCFSRQFMNFL